MLRTRSEDEGMGVLPTARSSETTVVASPGSERSPVDRLNSSSTMVNQIQEHPNDQPTPIDLNNDGSGDTAEKDLEKNLADPPPPYINPREAQYGPPRPYRYEKLCQKTPGLMDHPAMTFGGPMIVLFDIIVPCVIYYSWYNARIASWHAECLASPTGCLEPKPEFDKDILGYAVISFGFGELYILLARVYRLYYYRDECAPLLSRSAWELDATSWVYLVSMVCALIPFVVGSTLVIPRLYLYAPAFLMAFLGLLMLATLIGFPIPIGINSHSPGTGIRPFIYYAAEDFMAVDGLQGREFRIRYNARYENSPGFRRLFLLLTIWWIIGVVVYILCLSAVVWTVEFHYAFGLSLGLLFSYIAAWGATTYLFVRVENRFEFERARDMGILADAYVE